MDRTVSTTSAPASERRLGGALEPVIGQVYFSPEAHDAYAELGFDRPTQRAGEVQLPDGPAYFTSRGSVMGDVSGEVIASAFADLGFDVDIGPLFQTPEEAVREAVENDVHVIGISSQAAGHKTLVPQVIQGLKDADAADIIVICGGVIPAQDHEELFNQGVAAIYGPGTNILSAAQEVLQKIKERRAS